MANGDNRTGLQTSEGKITAIVTAFSGVLNALATLNIIHLDQQTRELVVQATSTTIAAVVSAYAIGRSIVKARR